MSPVKIGIIGCGAVAEIYYAPALSALVRMGRAMVACLIDPNAERRAVLRQRFPTATQFERVEEVPAGSMALAIVASPPRFHAAQARWLIDRGCHVLCEKPLATNLADAEAMVAAGRGGGPKLAVGLIRRFFPALQEVRQIVKQGTFGPLHRFQIEEGGPFNWPAATPSFFDPQQAGGGVLLDTGPHVLDVLDWWLGEPGEVRYGDDAAGGLEATARLEISYAAGTTGSVLLSRDWKTANRWTLEFERVTIVWRVGEANRLEIRAHDSAHWLVAQLEKEESGKRTPADTYTQAFTRQVLDAIECATDGREPRVPGTEALRSMRLIERCYRERAPLRAEVR